jgi:cobalt/nickel transport protein|uniref:PDGLE domain-containing protein n=1 Tax=Candidatus Planktophila sp. TaxID=2175601 RepID=UPI0040493D3E
MISNRKFIVMGVLVSALLAGGASFYANSNPDGLEKVAQDIGFIQSAKDNANADSSLADYGLKGIENERLSVGVAGLIGVVATGAISGGLFLLLRRKKPKN